VAETQVLWSPRVQLRYEIGFLVGLVGDKVKTLSGVESGSRLGRVRQVKVNSLSVAVRLAGLSSGKTKPLT
jgi:hypothetical protein